MVCNPNRSTQGGDVEGTEAMDANGGLTLKPTMVSKASYNPNYSIGRVFDDGINTAVLKVGYTSYNGRKKT